MIRGGGISVVEWGWGAESSLRGEGYAAARGDSIGFRLAEEIVR